MWVLLAVEAAAGWTVTDERDPMTDRVGHLATLASVNTDIGTATIAIGCGPYPDTEPVMVLAFDRVVLHDYPTEVQVRYGSASAYPIGVFNPNEDRRVLWLAVMQPFTGYRMDELAAAHGGPLHVQVSGVWWAGDNTTRDRVYRFDLGDSDKVMHGLATKCGLRVDYSKLVKPIPQVRE